MTRRAYFTSVGTMAMVISSCEHSLLLETAQSGENQQRYVVLACCAVSCDIAWRSVRCAALRGAALCGMAWHCMAWEHGIPWCGAARAHIQ